MSNENNSFSVYEVYIDSEGMYRTFYKGRDYDYASALFSFLHEYLSQDAFIDIEQVASEHEYVEVDTLKHIMEMYKGENKNDACKQDENTYKETFIWHRIKRVYLSPKRYEEMAIKMDTSCDPKILNDEYHYMYDCDMPQDGDVVLVEFEDGVYDVCEFVYCDSNDWKPSIVSKRSIEEVIAWAYFPEH